MGDRSRLEVLLDRIDRAQPYHSSSDKEQVLKLFDEALVDKQRGEASVELLAGHVRARVEAEMKTEALLAKVEGLGRAAEKVQELEHALRLGHRILDQVEALHTQGETGRCQHDGTIWPCATVGAMRLEVPE